MKKVVALDWDREEFRFALGEVHRKRVDVVAAGVRTWVANEDGTPLSAEDQGKQIRDQLKGYKVNKATAILFADRSRVEELHLTLPPLPDQELPGVVMNQAILESPGLTEESLLDFVPDLPAEGGAQRKIVALAANPVEIENFKTVCQGAGLQLKSVEYRPYAATVPFSQSQGEMLETTSLVVTLYRDEVELTVVEGTRVQLSRHVRLPGPLPDEGAENRLLGEIRRTLLVAPQHLTPGNPLADVRLQGTPEIVSALLPRVQSEVGLPALRLNPLEGGFVKASEEVQDFGGMAPLAGALILEGLDQRPAIDFLNPRKPVVKKSNRRQLVLGALLLMVAGYFGYEYWQEQTAKANATLNNLNKKKSELTANLKKIEKQRKVAEALAQWELSSPNWLDELRELTVKLPAGEDVTLSRLTLSPGRGTPGLISFAAAARTPEVVIALENALRDSSHGIQTPGIMQRGDKRYPWGFESTVSVARKPAVEAAKGGGSGNAPQGAKKETENPKKPEVHSEKDKKPEAALSEPASSAVKVQGVSP